MRLNTLKPAVGARKDRVRVGRPPVVVGQVDRGGGNTRGNDGRAGTAEIVARDVDRRAAVDGELTSKDVLAQSIG